MHQGLVFLEASDVGCSQWGFAAGISDAWSGGMRDVYGTGTSEHVAVTVIQ